MGVSVTQGQLATIADKLKNSAATTRVALQEKENTVQVSQESNGLLSWLGRGITHVTRFVYNISPVAYFCGQSIAKPAVPLEASSTTAEYFQKVFGEKRICRIDNKLGKYGIHFGAKQTGRDYFCKADVEKIFVGSSEMEWGDYEELFHEIKDMRFTRVRFLSEEETALVRYYFRDQEKLDPSKVKKTDLDILSSILSPFAKIEHIFLHKLPISKAFSFSVFYETAIDEMKKRVLSYETLRGLKHDSSDFALILAKELSPRSIPPRVMLPHLDGYLLHCHKIVGGGEMKYLLKSLASSLVPSYVLYCGTRINERASRDENYRTEMAVKGPYVTRMETAEYFHDPKKGFVTIPTEQLAAIGFSQGGVHAQRGALLFFPKFSSITTVCSPGIEKASALLHAELVQKSGKKVKIVHITEPGDQVSEFGEARLGLDCDPALADVSFAELTLPGKKVRAVWARMPSPASGFAVIKKIMGNAYTGAHLRPILGREVEFSKILSSKRPQERATLREHLLPGWEIRRKELIQSRLFRVNEPLPSFVKVCASIL